MTQAVTPHDHEETQARHPQVCRACAHFCNDAVTLEAEVRGLTSFSSAYASVRDEDGLCLKHDRYLSADRTCRAFVARDGG